MIQGCSIVELQAKITISEFRVWLAYRKKYGPMNPVRTYDAGPAIIASLISQAHGGKATPKDFMPYGHTEEEEMSVDDLMKAFRGGVKIGKRR